MNWIDTTYSFYKEPPYSGVCDKITGPLCPVAEITETVWKEST